ncbi:protein kinase domain-containing protein [Streptomyces gossypiisoli]|uniref:protein kinase domain-containing protein n=1 Tax=Streptomyces gossypiisoli TaxID=2748864 RepID=UPI0015DA8A98
MRALGVEDPERVADYRLLGRLGEGGMGVVYLARSPRGRMVAVKSIRAELAAVPDFRSRFAKEIAVARQVGGDWTAAVLDADPHAERPWIATAYVPGPTLAEVVARHGPLPEESVRGLASGLCRALGDIHGAGLVHRDLKPSNIMITIDGPKVIDFGIVRALDGSTGGGLTSTGVIVGSPGFMAPEQVLGERLTGAADIFSLGAVLAFAASGHMAFGSAEVHPHALMYRVVHEEPDLAGVPEPLLALIRDCLAKDPAARPTLADLRAREGTSHRRLGPWLPAEVLARLGQDAAQLLAHEDPHTRATVGAVTAQPDPPSSENVTVRPAQPPTALAAPEHTAEHTAEWPDRSEEPAEPRPTLAEERNARKGARPFAVAVHVWLALYAAVVAGALLHLLEVLNGRYDDSIGEEYVFGWTTAQGIACLGLVVSWLLWFAKARAVAEGFAPGRLRHRPSMAVLAWFIPIGNLYLPKQIANDVWHASSPPRPDGGTAPAGRLHTWWVFWLVTLLTWPLLWGPVFLEEELGEKWHSTQEDPSDRDYVTWYTYDLDEFGAIGLVLRILAIPTVVVTARYVHGLTALQTARLSA